MPPLSRRALLATVAAGVTGGVAECNALSREPPPTPTQADGFGRMPLYVADGVPLPEGAEPLTVPSMPPLVGVSRSSRPTSRTPLKPSRRCGPHPGGRRLSGRTGLGFDCRTNRPFGRSVDAFESLRSAPFDRGYSGCREALGSGRSVSNFPNKLGASLWFPPERDVARCYRFETPIWNRIDAASNVFREAQRVAISPYHQSGSAQCSQFLLGEESGGAPAASPDKRT